MRKYVLITLFLSILFYPIPSPGEEWVDPQTGIRVRHNPIQTQETGREWQDPQTGIRVKEKTTTSPKRTMEWVDPYTGIPVQKR